MRKIITFGTFDILHIGHIRILKRARALGDYLIVGISSDQLNYLKKKRFPVYPEVERMEIISSITGVDQVFLEESLELKADYIEKYKADVLVMGSDWEGRFDELKNLCEVVYVPRTEGISTTELIQDIKAYE